MILSFGFGGGYWGLKPPHFPPGVTSPVMSFFVVFLVDIGLNRGNVITLLSAGNMAISRLSIKDFPSDFQIFPGGGPQNPARIAAFRRFPIPPASP